MASCAGRGTLESGSEVVNIRVATRNGVEHVYRCNVFCVILERLSSASADIAQFQI